MQGGSQPAHATNFNLRYTLELETDATENKNKKKTEKNWKKLKKMNFLLYLLRCLQSRNNFLSLFAITIWNRSTRRNATGPTPNVPTRKKHRMESYTFLVTVSFVRLWANELSFDWMLLFVSNAGLGNFWCVWTRYTPKNGTKERCRRKFSNFWLKTWEICLKLVGSGSTTFQNFHTKFQSFHLALFTKFFFVT